MRLRIGFLLLLPLLGAASNVEASDNQDSHKWWLAAAEHNLEQMVQIVAQGFKPQGREIEYVFTNAASYGHLDVLKWMKDNFSINQETIVTSIENARYYNRPDVVSWFQENFPNSLELLS